MMNEIIRHRSTGSTNKDAAALAEQGARHGTAVIADSQNEGRGRLGKNWQSPVGKGLYSSIILRPELDIESYPQITFVAGLAVAAAVERLYPLTVGLKWPNDIFFGSRKCGGILTESSEGGDSGGRYAIVGIGLNVNTASNEFMAELKGVATSLYIESGIIGDLEQLFTAIREELLNRVKLFEHEGFGPVIKSWRQRDCMLGKRLQWVTVAGNRVEGVSLGPDDQGRLHVRDDQNNEHEVLSGDIRLATGDSR